LVIAECDATHDVLVQRADALEGCTQRAQMTRNSSELFDAIEAYEAVRWPTGRVNGGKG
jgi:hypothetical protein